MRLPLFLQPLGRALKKWSAAPASPPCFRRRRRSAPLLFESTRPVSLALQQNKNLSVLSYVEVFLVGAGGFEPPKLKAADLQSVPIGHSGTRPYSFLCVRSPDDLLILAWEMDFVNCFLLFSSKVFCARRRRGAAMRLALCENGGYPSFLLQKYLLDKRQIRRLRIAFCAILCYNSGRTEQKTAGAFCRFARWEG